MPNHGIQINGTAIGKRRQSGFKEIKQKGEQWDCAFQTMGKEVKIGSDVKICKKDDVPKLLSHGL